jgi:hypothetical protein
MSRIGRSADAHIVQRQEGRRAVLPQPQVGRKLDRGGRLTHAGGAHQYKRPRTGSTVGPPQSHVLKETGKQRPQALGPEPPVIAGQPFEVIDQFGRKLALEVLRQQVLIELGQLRRGAGVGDG